MIPALENHLWQSTVFAVVAWLLTMTLRNNRAALRHGIWLAASIKFLLPFSLLFGLSQRLEWRIASVFMAPRPVNHLILGAPHIASEVSIVIFGVWLCGFAANCLVWRREWQSAHRALRSATSLPISFHIPVKS